MTASIVLNKDGQPLCAAQLAKKTLDPLLFWILFWGSALRPRVYFDALVRWLYRLRPEPPAVQEGQSHVSGFTKAWPCRSRTATGWTSSFCSAASGATASGATASGARSVPRVSSSSLSSTPCPGLATEHFTVLALVRYVCLTLMTFAVYSFEFQTMMTDAIYSCARPW